MAEVLPDRGLEHEPRLTAAEARAKAEAELREIPHQEIFPALSSSPENGEGSFAPLHVSAMTGKITPRDNILRYWDR